MNAVATIGAEKGGGRVDLRCNPAPRQARWLAATSALDAFQSAAVTTLESLEKTVFGFASQRAFNYVRGRRITPRAFPFS
jgi:hypothetical protein